MEPFNLIIVGYAICFAHFPDADFLPFLILRKKIKWNDMCGGHWPYGHHPIIVIPLSFILSLAFHKVMSDFFPEQWTKDGMYVAWVALMATTLHFLHDSAQPQGLHWFSPIKWTHYTLRRGWPKKIPHEKTRQFYKLHNSSHQKKSVTHEFTSRIPRMTDGEIFLIILSGTALIVFLMIS